MGVRLSADEAWEFVQASHTGVFTTLRRDGVPVSLPVWFVVDGQQIYMQTPDRSKKIARVRNDARSSFVVESGKAWTELKAVSLTGTAAIVSDDEAAGGVLALLGEKYADFGIPTASVPDATKKHYSRPAVVCFTPDERQLTWDNAKLRLKGS